jgi:hypothetical protein
MKPRAVALLHFSFFTILILTGIVVKRVFGHPEYMVFFHLPAAVFLVLWGLAMKQARQTDYEQEVQNVRARLQSDTETRSEEGSSVDTRKPPNL